MKIIDSGTSSAPLHMARDAFFLKELADQPEGVLHFYEWEKPSATYGYFVDPYQYLKAEIPLTLARRPTGGGVIFHLTDLAFSVLIPASHPRFSLNTLDNYRFINSLVVHALQLFQSGIDASLLAQEPELQSQACGGFCMAKPTQYDVMIKGKKVAGGAQRRTRHGFLHQGSICLALPRKEEIEALFKPGLDVWEGMQANSYALLDAADDIPEGKIMLKKALEKSFCKH